MPRSVPLIQDPVKRYERIVSGNTSLPAKLVSEIEAEVINVRKAKEAGKPYSINQELLRHIFLFWMSFPANRAELEKTILEVKNLRRTRANKYAVGKDDMNLRFIARVPSTLDLLIEKIYPNYIERPANRRAFLEVFPIFRVADAI